MSAQTRYSLRRPCIVHRTPSLPVASSKCPPPVRATVCIPSHSVSSPLPALQAVNKAYVSDASASFPLFFSLFPSSQCCWSSCYFCSDEAAASFPISLRHPPLVRRNPHPHPNTSIHYSHTNITHNTDIHTSLTPLFPTLSPLRSAPSPDVCPPACPRVPCYAAVARPLIINIGCPRTTPPPLPSPSHPQHLSRLIRRAGSHPVTACPSRTLRAARRPLRA